MTTFLLSSTIIRLFGFIFSLVLVCYRLSITLAVFLGSCHLHGVEVDTL